VSEYFFNGTLAPLDWKAVSLVLNAVENLKQTISNSDEREWKIKAIRQYKFKITDGL